MPDGSRRLLQGKFEAKKHAVRQTQDGWVVSFVVHPNDMTPEFSVAPLGTRLMIAYAEYVDDETPLPPAPPASSRPRDAAPPGARSEQAKAAFAALPEWKQAAAKAGMLCKDRDFQRWFSRHADFFLDPGRPEMWEVVTTDYLRRTLRIPSRSIIGTDEGAFNRFTALETDWKIHNGELPRPR